MAAPARTRLAESLAASRLQNEIGAKAAAELDSEIERLTADLESLRSEKPSAIRAVLLEFAAGFRSDMLTAIDQLREAAVVLAALDKITARGDGSYSPNERIVVEVPTLGGLPAQACVVPSASIETAMRVWGKYAQTLASNPLASADEMLFPAVDPRADDGLVSYDRLTPTERNRVDQLRSLGA